MIDLKMYFFKDYIKISLITTKMPNPPKKAKMTPKDSKN